MIVVIIVTEMKASISIIFSLNKTNVIKNARNCPQTALVAAWLRMHSLPYLLSHVVRRSHCVSLVTRGATTVISQDGLSH